MGAAVVVKVARGASPQTHASEDSESSCADQMALALAVACSLGLILAPVLPHRGACRSAHRRASVLRCVDGEQPQTEQRAYRVAVPANSELLAARTKKQVEVKQGIQVVNIGGKTIDFGHDMTNTFK